MGENAFDIFKSLRLSEREDVLHTPMIAGLLDPLGLHGLDDLFLGRFLKSLSCSELPLTRQDAADYHWLVRQEHYFLGGRIDILLLCREKRIAIAIENKIRSKESQDTPKRGAQLPRYLEWLRTLSPYFTNVRPYLLSLEGAPAVTLPPHKCGAISYETVLQCLLTCFEDAQRVPADLRSYARTVANFLPPESASRVRYQGWTRTSEPAEETVNIFHFLGISRRESALHTRMLAFLLDPTSSHNHGSTFLRSFVKLLGDKLSSLTATEREQLLGSIGCDWQVQAEFRFRGRVTESDIEKGCIDIRLACPQKGLLVAIENKIDAGEGPDQLYRYSQWMSQQTAFSHSILVFLTIEGTLATSARTARYHVLSYKEILTLVSDHHTKLEANDPVKAMLRGYCDVLTEILPQPGISTRTADRRLIPFKDHGTTALDFLREFVAEWPRLRGYISCLSLHLNPDKDGKWHGIWVWPEELRKFQTQQIIIPRIAIIFGNKPNMGLRAGLRWTNRQPNDKDERSPDLDEWRDLRSLAEKIYKVQAAHRKGHWFAICERLDNARSDGGLVSLLQTRKPELHQLIASTIHNIWAFCGDRLWPSTRNFSPAQECKRSGFSYVT